VSGQNPTSEEQARANYVQAFEPQELVELLVAARGMDVVTFKVTGRCHWTDHFIISTAKSPRHIRMLAAAVLNAVKLRTDYVAGGKLAPSIEGADGPNGQGGDDHWMLVDCGSCVVQIFSDEARERYALEQLWAPGQQLVKHNHGGKEILTLDNITVDGNDDNSGMMTVAQSSDDDDDEDEDEEGEEAEEEEAEEEGEEEEKEGSEDIEGDEEFDGFSNKYTVPPAWDRSITEQQETRLQVEKNARKGAGGSVGIGGKGGFGSTKVKLDLD